MPITFSPQSLSSGDPPALGSTPPPTKLGDLWQWLDERFREIRQRNDWAGKTFDAIRRDFIDLQEIIRAIQTENSSPEQDVVFKTASQNFLGGLEWPSGAGNFTPGLAEGVLFGTGGVASRWVLPLQLEVGRVLRKVEVMAQSEGISVIIRSLNPANGTYTDYGSIEYVAPQLRKRGIALEIPVLEDLQYQAVFDVSGVAGVAGFSGLWTTTSNA